MASQTDESILTMLRDSAKDYLSSLDPISRFARRSGGDSDNDLSCWKEIAELGWLALMLPESIEGSGLELSEACLLAELMGEFQFGEPFVEACVLPSVIVRHALEDNEEGALEIAKHLIDGHRRLAFAWQEEPGQYFVENISTITDDKSVSGRKRFVANAFDDSILLVVVKNEAQNIELVAVDASGPGAEIHSRPFGLGRQAEITFSSAPLLGGSPLLSGAHASAAIERALDAGRLALAAQMTGAARGCLNKTLAYVGQREQFARAIGSFQTVQHRCVDMFIEIRLASESWQNAVRCYLNNADADETQAAISRAKARSGKAAMMVAKQSVQLHGAMGFAEETGVGLYLRAAMADSASLGSVHEHQRRFSELYRRHKTSGMEEGSGPENKTEEGGDPREWSDEAFRQRLRVWLNEYYPKQLKQNDRRPFLRLRGEDLNEWLRLLNDHGWRAPAWPQEYGGMGLSFSKQRIYQEEMERAAVGRIIDTGESQLGPTLMKWGTREQREHYLPRILDCTDVWCQGYSEPGSGSDLASLRTKAVRDGNEFVVNGQKIWTTHATDATHIFTLVRTGNFDKKQQGISFLLIDLSSPGIDIRPIDNIAGEDEFCEVFFDDVRVPAENLVGELHEGWTVAKTLLGHERIWLGSAAMAKTALDLAERLVKQRGLGDDVGVQDRLGELAGDLYDYQLLYASICDAVAESGEAPGPEASMLKVYVGELQQRITEFSHAISGEYGGVVGDVRIGELETDIHWPLMMARPVTIYAGANEIQRDILAKAVLGMPRAK